MALTNSEKQAAHRERKEVAFEKVSQELARTAAENRDFREKIDGFEKKIAAMEAAHEKKVANLKARLLRALESNAKA